jgi:lysine biosynthesis protein LysW
MATCPECDAEIEIDPDDLDELEAGDPWSCDACGSALRVATLEPLEFDGDEEDDEEDDEDDEDAEGEEEEDDDLDDDDDEEEDDEKDWDE